MRYAAIGIGSNSTRMVIGEAADGALSVAERLREGTRLFTGLEDGNLSRESMERVALTVARFSAHAREAGAGAVRVIATSAARDAKNGAELSEMVEALCGEPLRILSGEEEARLSFLGVAGEGFCGMIDLGGGSTEVAVGGGGRPLLAGSAQLGALRLQTECPDLSGPGYERALALARERVLKTWEELSARERPVAWWGVGGTLTCLGSMDMELPAYDRDAVEGHVLTQGAVERWARRLISMPAEARRRIPGIYAQRADIIAHGAVALLGTLEALSIPRLTVSNRANLDGCLREMAAAGPDSVEVVRSFYDASVEAEWERLDRHPFEFAINKHYIDRYVRPGDRVLDVGGGPGRYSLHLAERGADVTLADLAPGNVAYALDRARERGLPLAAICADAREIGRAAEGGCDAILLMGPLYHLKEEADRARAVAQCLELLKPGGVLFAAFISTAAGMIYAGREMPESILWEGEDQFYAKIIAREDFAGKAFTEAFFIEPGHVLPFMERFPLETLHLVSSEGIAGPFEGRILQESQAVRDAWLALSLRLCEREDFRGYAEHFLYVGRKREEGESI